MLNTVPYHTNNLLKQQEHDLSALLDCFMWHTNRETVWEKLNICSMQKALKGTHTVYFSSSLYIINQKPMISRTHFHCKTT